MDCFVASLLALTVSTPSWLFEIESGIAWGAALVPRDEVSIAATALCREPLQKITNDAAQQIELVPRHRQRFCAGGRLPRGVRNGFRICRRALQRSFGRGEAERDGCDSAG